MVGAHNKIDFFFVYFQLALEHDLCDKLYLTHIYHDYPADTFFPKFEHNFIEIR